jgi:N-acetylmuramic acid 6-phosphate etherase
VDGTMNTERQPDGRDERDATLDGLVTEQHRPGFAGLDQLPTAETAALMNAEDARIQAAVAACLPQITAAVDAIADRMAGGGRLIYVGAGTSGRIGALDASEIPATFSTSPDQVQAMIAGGPDEPASTAGGAEDDEAAGAHDLDARKVTERDAVVGISASGCTPYVAGALGRARQSGALTVALAANPKSVIGGMADVTIEVMTGPEFIAGSTRLKAGTAQKLVLNMISTIVMVRLGKTYGNLMVDVQATSGKLRGRARRIVAAATGAGDAEAAKALDAAGGDVKTAITMMLTGAEPAEADGALRASGGRLREALGRLQRT